MKGRHAMVVRWYLVRRMLAFFWICIFVIGFTVYILDKYNSSVTGDAMRLSFEDRIFRLQEDLQRIQALLNNSKRECHSKNSVPKLPADDSENSATLQLPLFADFLPHLHAYANSVLYPAVIYPQNSSRKIESNIVIGIPTVARRNQSYLLPTLQSLIGGISSNRDGMVAIVVLVSDFLGSNSSFVKQQCASLQSEFFPEINSGLLTIIVPPIEWYPSDLHSVVPTFNDSPDRMYWRTKQNLDYMYLMLYCQRRGQYYLQLEDDVLVKPGYVHSIEKFISDNAAVDWFMLEFSSLGFIGKLFRTSDLKLLVQFIAMFYRQKPVDWLLDLLFINRYCHPEKSDKNCAEVVKRHRIRHRPSLFQHIGVHSSLTGKLQKLRERDFGKDQLYIPHNDNPPAKITTSLKTYMVFDINSAYDGRNYYWAFAPVAHDYILFEFYSVFSLIGVVIRTGNPEHQDDILNETAELLIKKINEDNFTSVARFNKRGTLRADFDREVEVTSMKIEIHERSSNWLIINEVHVIVV